ncbi:uncharacterized protein KZ484_025439 [Pholidichthys leucotaenia]
MSEDSSSDNDWCPSTTQSDAARCWECGKHFRKLKHLMVHYKSHNIRATCHICKVTFRRSTSLSVHLDNVHSPPFCKKCHQSFRNVWELNKHAGTRCRSSESLTNKRQTGGNFSKQATVQQRAASDLTGTSMEYTIGEDEDLDTDTASETTDDSSRYDSDSDEEDGTSSSSSDLTADDSETDSSSSFRSDTSNSLKSSKAGHETLAASNHFMCTVCGKGPLKHRNLHMLRCKGAKIKYQCYLCKKSFDTDAALKKHRISFISCNICGQVFTHKDLYCNHQCPKGSILPLYLFCSEFLPKPCNICKSFFTSEKMLSNHVIKVHASVVSTKVCVITNPSRMDDKKVKPGMQSTKVQPAVTRSNTGSQAINGKLGVGQVFLGSQSSVVKHSLSAVAPVIPGQYSTPGQPTSQPLSHHSGPLSVLAGPTDTARLTPASGTSSSPKPTTVAAFQHGSQDAALVKCVSRGWRSKAPYPCRHCGVILRQHSLVITHRYLHRGRRVHQCLCGRAFKHRLHLLRHCVQHTEAVSYICTSCGDTFTGAKLLAEHLRGTSLRKSHLGCTQKSEVESKCRMSFACDCGELFYRPSAYIWHQIKNKTKSAFCMC